MIKAVIVAVAILFAFVMGQWSRVLADMMEADLLQ